MNGGMRGRAARGNPPGRFARTRVEEVDDGWYREATPDSIATRVEPDFPPGAEGREAEVVVTVLVDAEGRVAEAKVTQSAGDALDSRLARAGGRGGHAADAAAHDEHGAGVCA